MLFFIIYVGKVLHTGYLAHKLPDLIIAISPKNELDKIKALNISGMVAG